MMPQWEDVTARMTNLGALADRQARRGRSARRDLHDPRREGRRAQPHATRAARPSASRRGRPTASSISYFSDKSGEYKLVHRGAGRPRAAARDRARRSRRTTTRRRGRPTRRSCSTPTPTSRSGCSTSRAAQAKIVGNDPWMVPQRTLNPAWSPDSKWVAYREPPRHRSIARSSSRNVETGETKQITDGLADAMWPAWDASGKYLWFLASTDFGLRSQWLDMTSYDRDETSGCTSRCCRRASRARCCRRATRIARQSRRAAARGGVARSGKRQQRASRAAPRPTVHDRFRRPAAAHPRGAGRAVRGSTRSCAPASPGTVFFLEAPARRTRRRGGGSTLHRYRLSDRQADAVR